MARAKTKTVSTAESVNDEAIVLEDALDFAAISPQLSAIQAEMGDAWDGAQWKMHVAKILPDAKEARVWDGPPEDYNLMDIARKFGSGDYRVKMYGPHESGRVVIRGSNVTAVLLSAEEDLRVNESRNPVKQNNGAQFDPMTFAQLIVTGITQALTPLIAQPKNPMEDLKGLADVIKTIMPAQAPQSGNNFMEMLAGFKAFSDLSRSMNPAIPVDGDGKPDAPGMALNKGIDLVGNLLQRHFDNQQSRPAAISAPIVVDQPAAAQPPKPTSETVIPQGQDQEEAMFEAQKAKIALEMLNRRATKHANARDEAEAIYDEDLPEWVLELICVNPQWFDYIVQLVPECATNKEWFELLRLRIYEMAQEDGVIDAKGQYVPEDQRPVFEVLTATPETPKVAGDGTPIQSDSSANGGTAGKPA